MRTRDGRHRILDPIDPWFSQSDDCNQTFIPDGRIYLLGRPSAFIVRVALTSVVGLQKPAQVML